MSEPIAPKTPAVAAPKVAAPKRDVDLVATVTIERIGDGGHAETIKAGAAFKDTAEEAVKLKSMGAAIDLPAAATE